MAKFIIKNNNLNDDSSIIKHLHEAPKHYETPEHVDFTRIEEELRAIKETLEKGSQEYQLVETLQENNKTRDFETIRSTIMAAPFQMVSTIFATLAASYLRQLLGF